MVHHVSQIFNRSVYDKQLAHVRDVRVWTNEFAGTMLSYTRDVPPTYLPDSRHVYGCMFKMLFRASPALEAALEQQMVQLFCSPQGPPGGYVAMHLRLGGAVGGCCCQRVAAVVAVMADSCLPGEQCLGCLSVYEYSVSRHS